MAREHRQCGETLSRSAKARGFEYLGLYGSDGDVDMIYGEEIKSFNPEPFLDSLRSGEEKVSGGSDQSGDRIILMGIPASYRMEDGRESVALVAAFPANYMRDALSLNENDNMAYSFVIRQDGSFVIRSSDAYRESYFERVRSVYESVGGKEPEQYIEELQASMAAGKDYSSELVIDGTQRYMYCSSLPYTEWYLITFISYGMLDSIIHSFSSQWVSLSLGSCFFILAVLLLFFILYFRRMQEQVRELERARHEAEQASRSKSEFLSNMSHDIRTPMNAIVGMTAIAAANISNTQQVQDCLKKITLSSKHLLGLINDVLDMSKIESGKMTLNMDQISLREVIDSIVCIVQPQIKAKQQKFDVFIHDITTEDVCCDSVRLNQILLNLLSNAIKFTPEGGSIQMALYEEASPKGEDYIRIHLQVKDTGIGMSQEFQKRIFESFSREDKARVQKTEGTGLGMAITKYIVDAMGGSIRMKSEQGMGTEFTIILDMERGGTREVDMILPDWSMLVVDDDRQLCESAVSSLESIGVKAEWALSGETAIDMVNDRHRKQQDYHVILLDWKLPGIDGIETARRIRRQLGEDIPILLISAYDWSEIEEDARAAGVNGFLSKPLFKSTLFYGLKPYMEDSDVQPLKEAGKLDFSGRRVLLAEDNELNWEVAEALLGELGLELDWAENGRICVEKFKQSPVGFYDMILMDIRMPEMTGYEASDAIRAMERADSSIPIIAMTADAFSEDIQESVGHGMDAHLAKPIDMKEVSRLLEKYLGR